MEKTRTTNLKLISAAALITVLIAAVAAATPIEDQLCIEYCPYSYNINTGSKHPWIPFWRVAAVMFFSWLVTASFASRKHMFFTWFMLTSSVAMAVGHYLQLAVIAHLEDVEITLLPFLYVMRSHGGELRYLDLAQVVIAATAVELYFILKRAPRTASNVRRTP